jgi:hypothetical protein
MLRQNIMFPIATDSATRRNHQAAGAVWGMGGIYVVHVAMALFVVGPANEQAAWGRPIFALIGLVVLALIVWAGAAVYRGGRLIGAVILAFLLLGGHGVSGALVARSIAGEHPAFLVLQLIGIAWAGATLFLLVRAHLARP